MGKRGACSEDYSSLSIFPLPLPSTPTLMHARIAVAASFIAFSAAPTAPALAQRPLKVYISADMEGIAGVVSPDQLGPTGFEYPRFRELMTAEVLAAIEGAREAGAAEIL
jgi:hypothetical protein